MERVNGYVCKNCTDVEYAKKNIDPAHPKDGPNGIDKPEKVAERKAAEKLREGQSDQRPAVILSGALSGVTPVQPAVDVKSAPYTPGSKLNIAA